MGHQPLVRVDTDQINFHHVLYYVVLHTLLHLPVNHEGFVLAFVGRSGEDVHIPLALHDRAPLAMCLLCIEFQVDL